MQDWVDLVGLLAILTGLNVEQLHATNDATTALNRRLSCYQTNPHLKKTKQAISRFGRKHPAHSAVLQAKERDRCCCCCCCWWWWWWCWWYQFVGLFLSDGVQQVTSSVADWNVEDLVATLDRHHVRLVRSSSSTAPHHETPVLSRPFPPLKHKSTQFFRQIYQVLP